MNKGFISSIIGVIFLVSSWGFAALPRYPIQPVTKAPVIDGDLDDDCWKHLPQVGMFVDAQGAVARVQTMVRLGCDRENLYLGARLIEPEMAKVQAKVTKHDEGVWADDDLEWFISPNENGSPFYVFQINSLGATDEGRDIDPSKLWNVAWKSAVKKEPKAWTVEMAVPFAALGQSAPGETATWRMNVCRGRPRLRDFTSWANTEGSFNTPANFGEVHFPKKVLLENVTFETTPLTRGGKLKIMLAGPAGHVVTRIFRSLDGDALKTVYDAVEIKPGNVGEKTFLFPEDGNISSAQVDLIENAPPRRIIYRSEGLVIKEGDPRIARLRKIEAQIRELKDADLPAALKTLQTGWNDRFERLKAKNNDDEGRTLYQELRFAQWIRRAPAPLRAAALLWFPVIPFTETDYDTLPELSQIGLPVRIQAIRGEYESGCVNLISVGGDRKHLLQVGPLKGPGGAVLPVDCFDVRILKNWYQAGKTGHKSTDGKGIWVGELLLKNDAIISSDHVHQRNTIHSTRDADTLQPVLIPRFHTRQFWLTLRVPENQAPGVYAGSATVLADGTEAGKIPVEVNILPLTREPTDFTWTMYYHQFYTGGKNPKEDRWNEQDLKLMAEYGLTSVFVQEGASEQVKDGFVERFDYSRIRKALELRKKYDLLGKTVFISTAWYTPSMTILLGKTAQELFAFPYYKANWVLFGKGLRELTNEFKLQAGYIYCLDEPGYDASGARMKAERILAEWSRAAGIGGASAITPAGAREVRGILEVPILDSPSGEIGPHRKKWDLPGEVWYYWHPLENPSYDRLLAGLMIWYGGFTGAAPWTYKCSMDKWDDWTGFGYGLRMMNYAYPGENGPVPTWELAAFREGADDVRYLEMLDRRVKKLSNGKLDAADRKVVDQARQLLDTPPKKFQGTAADLPGKLKARDFDEFRKTVVERLLQLERIASKIPA